MNATPITAETITMILDEQGVPAELRTDPEVQAAAYGLAFLNSPATPAEERFHGASTVFYDEENESRYEVSNRDLLEEQLTARLSVRTVELAQSDDGMNHQAG
ncbi:hypothetical protein [Paenarthrobacter nitroguajacolicus]|uniref:hypothetical protein n=1 Tax=Paenarthrobacter nitroguajacolicus TaxID=211146 RepID=UPI0028600504|nr:hypothetical protein [Paenarthrobacter nitroguajacolicus]MDR6639571.1 hypothetical protein [Paenarthrobacter nitroguajacolicus]